ncbi:peptidoglycan-binding protein [Microbispora sp. RL4-1S]|uniref:Peptidoglycan-binding protein n=1 Tax=Microbispora oryzae TaxID=2806554 RepID=A0A940WUJ7_9ACTN|nr:peptidoglycan-binding protein [Microbispora oryzae]MBP2707436.1 peptidoglycan-binding protein [Microbispora oryzae]
MSRRARALPAVATVVSAVAVTTVVVGGGVTAIVANRQAEVPADANRRPPATAEITRSDLVDSRQVGGTLGYPGRRVLPNFATGIVTRTRAEGSVVHRGQWLYEVERRPVILMYGSIPMYRRLLPGTRGADVEQLERNLRALGYDPGPVDPDYTWRTARAVRKWQDDNRLSATGAVDSAQIVVASAALRIAADTAVKGDVAGRSVITTTGTRRTVHIELPASYQQFARKGAAVTVELPDGRTVKGRISAVGATATVAAGKDAQATIDVEAVVTGRLGRLDQAPVSVLLRTERHRNVLSVPIEALLALREGGYGVRVVNGTTTRVVSVKTGLYALSRVEISGPGLGEGMRVEVPEG